MQPVASFGCLGRELEIRGCYVHPIGDEWVALLVAEAREMKASPTAARERYGCG